MCLKPIAETGLLIAAIAPHNYENRYNTIDFSVISAWEIVIKQQTGKLTLPELAETYIPSRLVANRFLTQTVELAHVLKIASLPNYHRDPFDRLLIAQSLVEHLPIATVDSLITQYPVDVIW